MHMFVLAVAIWASTVACVNLAMALTGRYVVMKPADYFMQALGFGVLSGFAYYFAV